MKATLTFDLPEEKSELLVCLKGNSYLVALWDLDQWLRSQYKYCDREEMQEVREKLREVMEARGCSLEDGD